jgi:hypothetical protein
VVTAIETTTGTKMLATCPEDTTTQSMKLSIYSAQTELKSIICIHSQYFVCYILSCSKQSSSAACKNNPINQMQVTLKLRGWIGTETR